MRLRQVRLKNFRCHADTTIDLGDHHSIVGPNGSGKTAILEAINYATSPFYLSSRLDERDFHNDDLGPIEIGLTFDRPFALRVTDGYTSQPILATEVQLTVKRRERAAPRRAFSDPFQVTHVAVPICYEASNAIELELPPGLTANDLPPRLTKTAQGYELTRKKGTKMTLRWDSLSLSGNAELVGFPDVFYFDREREKETKVGFNSLFTKIARDLNWRYRRDWDRDTALSRWDQFYDPVIETVEDKKRGTILDPLRSKLSELLGSDFSGLEISLLDLEQPFSKSFLSFREGTNHVGLDGAGSGVGMLAALILLEQVSERSGGDLILLIDEPEMHLHPQLQEAFAGHLLSSAFQTVVSTHSHWFIDLGTWRSISRVTASQRFPQAHTLAAEFMGKPLEAHLDEIPTYRQHETVFVPHDSELLFARKLLLVEGPVDKYGLPRLAATVGKSFPHVTIVSCNGKSKIPYFALLATAFGLDSFVLFDLDGKGVDHEENQAVIRAHRPSHTAYFDISLEALLGVSSNAAHKASTALLQVDALQDASEVPEAIKAVVDCIATWAGTTAA